MVFCFAALDIWGFPYAGLYTLYGGGGYIEEFQVNRDASQIQLQELFDNLWLDRQTRVFFLEFVVFNPATNLFVNNIFVVEFPATGGVVTSFKIYPFSIYQHMGPFGVFTLVCEIIFVFFLLILLVTILMRIYQQRWGFFRQFWSVVDLILFLLGVVAICFYLLRYFMAEETISKFSKRIQSFVSFGHIVWWDELFNSIFAAISFIVTLKFLLILQELKDVKAVIRIFEKCGRDLLWNGTSFLVTLVGFSLLGRLLFGSQIPSYKTVLNSIGTLFIAMIGKSKYSEISEINPFLANIFFFVFIVASVFFFLTFFMSVLGGAIDDVMHRNRKKPLNGIIKYFLHWLKGFIYIPSGKANVSDHDSKRPKRKGRAYIGMLILVYSLCKIMLFTCTETL